MDIRTRIAPSPTGEDLHIGNAYTALINYAFAKKHGGRFVVRIEDTDKSRLVKGSEERILESLSWLGIRHDEGPDIGGPYAPYRQSDELPLYKKHAEELVKKGFAYYCFCTQERLGKVREEQMSKKQPSRYDGACRNISNEEAKRNISKGKKYTIRLKVPKQGNTEFHDLIRGKISFENSLIDDQVLLKSDGYPTYHLAVVVDDHRMNITHIIRGEEWISSVPKHVLLYNYFGWKMPIFVHLPLLRNPDKSKLSKRKNPVWVSWYRLKGFLSEAVVNYLATLAWSYPQGKDIFSLKEMTEALNLEDIQTSAPIFDIEKLRWMNGEYIRRYQKSKIKDQILKFYKNKLQEEVVEKTIPLVQERMKTLSEFESLAGFFFERPINFERPVDKKNLSLLSEVLSNTNWDHDSLEKAIRDKARVLGLKAKDLFMDLRVAITGKTVGPPLLESLEILGKEETLARLTIVIP